MSLSFSAGEKASSLVTASSGFLAEEDPLSTKAFSNPEPLRIIYDVNEATAIGTVSTSPKKKVK